MSEGEKIAKQAIGLLKSRGCDFTLLFWLRNPDLLEASFFGRDLLGFMRDLDVSVDRLNSGSFRDGFFQRLRKEFNACGIHPVAPQNFVVDRGAGGKERAIQKAAQEHWPRPYQTFCFQTRGSSNSAFFVFQCWQDGLRKILALLECGECTAFEEEPAFDVQQIYEHCWGVGRASRLLIDWEVETPMLGGRRTAAEARAAAEAFPTWFVQRLVKVGMLDRSERVRCTVKDKSRPISGGEKISMHFTFNLAGHPKVRPVARRHAGRL